MFGGGIDRRPQTITTIEIQGQQLYEWERAHKKGLPKVMVVILLLSRGNKKKYFWACMTEAYLVYMIYLYCV